MVFQETISEYTPYLESGIKILPYNPDWPIIYQHLSDFIFQRLDPQRNGLVMEHVGSTSIPGMPSKGIIDILGITIDVIKMHQRLIALGLQISPYPNRIDNDKPLLVGSFKGFSFHMHLCIPCSVWITYLVGKRNLLRTRPDLSAQYAAIKLQFAKEQLVDAKVYADAKIPFMNELNHILGIN